MFSGHTQLGCCCRSLSPESDIVEMQSSKPFGDIKTLPENRVWRSCDPSTHTNSVQQYEYSHTARMWCICLYSWPDAPPTEAAQPTSRCQCCHRHLTSKWFPSKAGARSRRLFGQRNRCFAAVGLLFPLFCFQLRPSVRNVHGVSV